MREVVECGDVGERERDVDEYFFQLCCLSVGGEDNKDCKLLKRRA